METEKISNIALNSPLKVGLVGTGFAAKKRAEALVADERSQLVFVVGNTLDKAQTFCETYGATLLESWQNLVNQPDLDLIFIASINRDRATIARGALEAGKNVVVEYPPALKPSDAASLINLAKTQGLLFHIEHIEILGGLHQAIRQNLPKIGTVFYARYITISPKRPAPRRWNYHHQLYGFPLSAALSRIHRFTDLFGSVTQVSCQSRFWDIPEADSYYSACLCAAQLRFNCGLIADITYGKGESFWQAQRTFELHGEQGSLIFVGEKGTLVQGETSKPIEVGSRRGLFAHDTTLVLDHLLTGKALYVEPQASYYALKIADAARHSAETGKTVVIE